jgi:hypothetical protein
LVAANRFPLNGLEEADISAIKARIIECELTKV